MKRARRLGLLALGAISARGPWARFHLRPRRPVAVHPLAPVVLPAPLTAGFAEADLTPTREISLGGFGSRHGADFTTVRDPVNARVLVLAGGGHRVGLVSLDVVLVPPPLAAAIATGAKGAGIDRVVVAATHTHNGPGGLWDDPLAELLGLGRYDARYTRRVVRDTVAALARAAKRAVPARLRLGTGEGPAVCRSRVPGRRPDRRLTVVEVDPARGGGPPLGRVVVFACHATVLGAHDHRLSAGWPGVLARHLDGTTVFLQGSGGRSTSAPIPRAASKDARTVALGETVAAAVRALPVTPAIPPAVRLGAATVDLPAPTGDTVAPVGLEHLAGNLLAPFAPRSARVADLTVGELTLALVPGEPAGRWPPGGPGSSPGAPGGRCGWWASPRAIWAISRPPRPSPPRPARAGRPTSGPGRGRRSSRDCAVPCQPPSQPPRRPLEV